MGRFLPSVPVDFENFDEEELKIKIKNASQQLRSHTMQHTWRHTYYGLAYHSDRYPHIKELSKNLGLSDPDLFSSKQGRYGASAQNEHNKRFGEIRPWKIMNRTKLDKAIEASLWQIVKEAKEYGSKRTDPVAIFNDRAFYLGNWSLQDLNNISLYPCRVLCDS